MRMFAQRMRCRSAAVGFQQVRFQSSVPYTSNLPVSQKTQLKQSKTQTQTQVAAPAAAAAADHKVPDAQNGGARQATLPLRDVGRDYSWLPKVPATTHLGFNEMSTKALYSGYRPLFISSPTTVEAGKKPRQQPFYEFALKIDEPSPWMTSATGLEVYTEWDNVPSGVQHKLKPLQPPPKPSLQEGSVTDPNALEKLKQQILAQEKEKLLSRPRGRKKPVISLLQLKKKLQNK